MGANKQFTKSIALGLLLGDSDPERSARVMHASLTMPKLDVGVLEAAADGAS